MNDACTHCGNDGSQGTVMPSPVPLCADGPACNERRRPAASDRLKRTPTYRIRWSGPAPSWRIIVARYLVRKEASRLARITNVSAHVVVSYDVNVEHPS